MSKQRRLKGKVDLEMKEFELSQKCRPFLGETGKAEHGKAEIREMQILQGKVQEDETSGCGEGIES